MESLFFLGASPFHTNLNPALKNNNNLPVLLHTYMFEQPTP